LEALRRGRHVRGVFPEALFALFACEDDLDALLERMIGGFLVAGGAIHPKLAARRSDGNLGVEDVLAHFVWEHEQRRVEVFWGESRGKKLVFFFRACTLCKAPTVSAILALQPLYDPRRGRSVQPELGDGGGSPLLGLGAPRLITDDASLQRKRTGACSKRSMCMLLTRALTRI
jgi:hypothetical protein